MWTIWREQNARCFEDQERLMEELKKLFIQTLFHWANTFIVPQVFHYVSIFVFMFLFLPLEWPFFVYILYTSVALFCAFP